MSLSNLMKCFLLTICVFFPKLSYAAVFYVDASSGSDSYAGTSIDTPWKTLSKVSSTKFSPGDTILLKRGEVWRETLSISSSGTQTGPIHYSSYGDETSPAPVINGSTLIAAQSWKLKDGSQNIYVAQIDKLSQPENRSFNQLYVDDIFFDVAHYPNSGFLIATANSPDRRSIIDEKLTLSARDLVGATVITKSKIWTLDPAEIIAFDESTKTIKTGVDTRYKMEKNYGYYFRDKLWMLDSEREWFLDAKNGLIYVWLPLGDHPSRHRIEVTARNRGIDGSSQRNFIISDISVTKVTGTAVAARDIANATFERLKLSSGTNGFQVRGDNISILNSKVENMTANGIALTGARGTVSKNLVNNIGVVGFTPDTTPLSISTSSESDHITISENTITNSGYVGIRFEGSYISVLANKVENFCLSLDDCAGIYTWAANIDNPFVGSSVVGNTVRDGIGNFSGTPYVSSQTQGIYLDDRVHDVEVINNVVENTRSGLYIHNSYNHVAKWNRFLKNRNAGILVIEDAYSINPGHVRNNELSNNTIEVGELALSFRSTLGSVKSFAKSDANVYLRPCKTEKIFEVQNNKEKRVQISLEDWRALTGHDMNSTETIGSCAAPNN